LYEYSKRRTFGSVHSASDSSGIRGGTIECIVIMWVGTMTTEILRQPTVHEWVITLCTMHSLTELFEGYTRLRNGNELDLLCYAVAIDMKFNEYTLALAGQEVEF
jgi:hypothetical protein